MIPFVVAGVIGYPCTMNGVQGVCVVLNEEGISPDCNGIAGFVEVMKFPDGTMNGWPGCGEESNVLF